jgi:ribonuclease HI
MELVAAINGLKALTEACKVTVITLCAATHKVISVMPGVMCSWSGFRWRTAQ